MTAASDPDAALRSLRAGIAADISWSRTENRTLRTAPALAARIAKCEREVDPDGVLPADERARRAHNLFRAKMRRLSLASAKARRARRGATPKT